MESLLRRVRKAVPGTSEIRGTEAVFADGRILVTVKFLEDYFNVSARTVRNWQKMGLVPAASKVSVVVLYDLHETIEWHRTSISKRHSANAKMEKRKPSGDTPPLDPIDPNNVDLATASIETLERLAKIEDVHKKRLQNAKERGELIPAEDTDRAMAEQAVIHVTQYSDDLDTLPAALANKSETYIFTFLEKHYERRIGNAHDFMQKVFDAPDWLWRKIKELIDDPQ
jgi:phage terminase Nu1 subunit (DNA packaging protein)